MRVRRILSEIIGRTPSPSFQRKEGLGGKRGLPVILEHKPCSILSKFLKVRNRDKIAIEVASDYLIFRAYSLSSISLSM